MHWSGWQRCMQQWILFCRWAALNLPWFWKNSRVSLESSYLGMGIPPYSSRWGCVSMQVTNVPKFQQITGVAFPACTFSHDSCLSYIKQSGILLAKCTNGNSFPFLSPKRNVRCQLHFHPEQSQATCKPNKKKWRSLEATLHSGRPERKVWGHWLGIDKTFQNWIHSSMESGKHETQTPSSMQMAKTFWLPFLWI